MYWVDTWNTCSKHNTFAGHQRIYQYMHTRGSCWRWHMNLILQISCRCTRTESLLARMSPCMLIAHNDHNDTKQIYSVMTHVTALEAGQSSYGTFEPITSGLLSLCQHFVYNNLFGTNRYTQRIIECPPLVDLEITWNGTNDKRLLYETFSYPHSW